MNWTRATGGEVPREKCFRVLTNRLHCLPIVIDNSTADNNKNKQWQWKKQLKRRSSRRCNNNLQQGAAQQTCCLAAYSSHIHPQVSRSNFCVAIKKWKISSSYLLPPLTCPCMGPPACRTTLNCVCELLLLFCVVRAFFLYLN